MARAENINPDILVWARESAGLSLEEAAKRLGIDANERVSAGEKLREFEAGRKFPTRRELTRFSSVYRRPLVAFYMQRPPITGERGEDFRAFPGAASRRDNALLDALVRDIRARQEMVRSLLEDEDQPTRRAYVASASMDDGVEVVARRIGEALAFSYRDARGRRGSPEDLFKELRSRVEAIGIFVLLVGDFGSHHSAIGEDVFRGFAIADQVAPFVVINDQDAKAARVFTLIHELAHIWLGKTGVSGALDDIASATENGKVEQFCNDVASEFLLPYAALGSRPDALTNPTKLIAAEIVQGISERWSVSEAMVAYRLHRLGWISKALYRELAAEYAARWRAYKEKTREASKDVDGGPSYYGVKQFRLGNALIDIVRRNLRENLLSHTKAAKLLGVKPGSVEPLLRKFEKSQGTYVSGVSR